MTRIPFMFLPFVLLGVAILNIFLAKSNRHFKKTDVFIEEERKANSTRKKDIPLDIYVEPKTDILPAREYNINEESHLNQTRNYVLSISKQIMLRLPKPMTNNEIKYEYGISNLENIIEWEDNYNKYIQGLIRLAELSLEAGYVNDAKDCLKESIRINSDYSKSYTILYDIYLDEKDSNSIKELKELVGREDFLSYDPSTRSKIYNYVR